jgi:uncharacterized protein
MSPRYSDWSSSACRQFLAAIRASRDYADGDRPRGVRTMGRTRPDTCCTGRHSPRRGGTVMGRPQRRAPSASPHRAQRPHHKSAARILASARLVVRRQTLGAGPCALERSAGSEDTERVETDGRGMRILDDEACVDLLRNTRLGRVAFTAGALPIILPVMFVWLDDHVVFTVGCGVLARAAETGQIVCFEADGVDQDCSTWWSVYVIGQLGLIDNTVRLEQLGRLELGAWSGSDDCFVELCPQLCSGRITAMPRRAPPEPATTRRSQS